MSKWEGGYDRRTLAQPGFAHSNGLLDADPRGSHVVMRYQGRVLLGEVVDVDHRNGFDWLAVNHFNGEPWPLQPMSSEVGVLVRTYEDDSD